MKFHPAAELFPLMDEARFRELVASVRTEGFRSWLRPGAVSRDTAPGLTRLEWSEGNAPCIESVFRVVRDRLPRCREVVRAGKADDRAGTDYLAIRNGIASLRIDLKLRDYDPIQRQGRDDLALETWSVVGSTRSAAKIGWTRDEAKNTDYVLWYWRASGRFCLVPFHPLCCVFKRMWQTWRSSYETHVQDSGDWQSECTYVPRQVVFEYLMRWSNGAFGGDEPAAPPDTDYLRWVSAVTR